MTAGGQARTVGELAAAAGDLLVTVTGDPLTAVSGVVNDSRKVAAGDLFFCVAGSDHDGHLSAGEAVAHGAVALCVERPTGTGVPEVVVADSRRAMGRMAAAFYGYPAADLLIVGVTGTNGKTTTVFLLESILAAEGMTTGLIGTIETRIAGRVLPALHTTPESLELQRTLADMRAAGAKGVAMEVSSHALSLHRVEEVSFRCAAFTNLSHDHLDFHASMDDYFEAKAALFRRGSAERGAVNIDDPYGARLKETAEIPCIGFGRGPDAEVHARDVWPSAKGTELTLVTPKGEIAVSTPLAGAFNIYNCLAAAATALQAGIGLVAIEAGLRSLRAVPGRFESIDCGQPFAVIVDYAHTPGSLEAVLESARGIAKPAGGRTLCVFGCGGDRDQAKRPLMGAVAARLADIVIVTSDNPRSEPPQAIIAEIVAGFEKEKGARPDAVIEDRAEAIAYALATARPGDAVVVAGKGHESVQVIGDRRVPFDDRGVARRTLRDLGWDPA